MCKGNEDLPPPTLATVFLLFWDLVDTVPCHWDAGVDVREMPHLQQVGREGRLWTSPFLVSYNHGQQPAEQDALEAESQ